MYGIVYGVRDGSVGNAVAGGVGDLTNDAVDTLYYKWGRKPILRWRFRPIYVFKIPRPDDRHAECENKNHSIRDLELSGFGNENSKILSD